MTIIDILNHLDSIEDCTWRLCQENPSPYRSKFYMNISWRRDESTIEVNAYGNKDESLAQFVGRMYEKFMLMAGHGAPKGWDKPALLEAPRQIDDKIPF